MRPILSLLLSPEIRTRAIIPSRSESWLPFAMALPCARQCFSSALEVIRLIHERQNWENLPMMEGLPAWWYEVFCKASVYSYQDVTYPRCYTSSLYCCHSSNACKSLQRYSWRDLPQRTFTSVAICSRAAPPLVTFESNRCWLCRSFTNAERRTGLGAQRFQRQYLGQTAIRSTNRAKLSARTFQAT